MIYYSQNRIFVYLAGLFLLVLFTISTQSIAESQIATVDQNVIIQQQKKQLQQAQQQRDEIRHTITLSPSAVPTSNDEDLPCYIINKIQFVGAEHFSISEQQKLTKSYLTKCLSVNKINELVQNVSNTYIEKGYITSRASLNEQNLSTGILVITIIEGKIKTFQLDGETPFALSMVFPELTGRILNLRDIEQGIDQLNRLPSQQITIDIQPSEQSGYSDVILKKIVSRLPVQASVGIDNSGQKSTGDGQINAYFSMDNLLHLADQWSFSASRNSDFRNSHKNWNISSGMTIPFGYWLFDYLYTQNRSFQQIPVGTGSYRYESQGQTHQLRINRTLFRDGQQKITLNMGFIYRQTTNIAAGTKLTFSSPTLNIVSLSSNYSATLIDGYLTFNPSFSRGIDILGATEDLNHDRNALRSRFRKFSLNSSYFIPISDDIYYLASLYGQFTPDNLYASERLSLGGQYSVRGFKEQYLIGNNGGYWRNELNWKLTRLPRLGELAINGAFDTGWLVNNKKQDSEGGNVTGASLGLSLNKNNINQLVTLGKPLIYPSHLKPDHWIVYWSVSLHF
jgi:hemolysin activation/secretion protein